MQRSNSWNRHSYPVQSEPAAGPPQKLDSTPEKPRLPKLPRDIRAVNDAESYKVHKGRNIIVLLDGTGDQFDSDNSSIVHLVSCLKKDDPSQVTYYQSGIGTYDGGGLSNGINAAVDMAVGSGLGVHIRDAYRFLMQTYREGDKICLFGFSRGAYTARCLAGMIHKVGVLPAHNTSQVQFAYQFYKDDSENGWTMSLEFKRTFCTDVNVYFVGCFDSVASVGFIPRKLPLSSTPTNKALYFRHAMALDERRAKFKPCRFQTKDTITPGAKWETVAEAHEDTAPNGVVRRFSSNLGIEKPNGEAPNGISKEKEEELRYAHPKEAGKLGDGVLETNIMEVWFMGCHADVGGGAVKNEVRHKLSQIPLRWMIRQCFECNTGILFNSHRLAEEGIDIHTLWPVYQKLQKPTLDPAPGLVEKYESGLIAPIARRSSALEPADEDEEEGMYHLKIHEDEEQRQTADHWIPEQVEDYFDALSPINDQLVVAKGWWILEVWPIKVRIQPKGSDDWIKKIRMNLGRHRAVQEHEPNLHWTVQHRMQADKKYKVKCRTDRQSVWRVVV